MMVSDLNHFLNLGDDVPAPAWRLAQHFGNVVRAATAGERVGDRWNSALPCRRRPGRRPCLGRTTIVRHDPPTPIQWRCSVCADEGVISNWEDSPYDLRRRRLTVVSVVSEVVITDEVAATLRELMFLDPDCERLVFGMHAHHSGGAVLRASEDDLEELIGFVAAEANHESNRRRQRRLDAAFDFLATAAHNMQRRGDVMVLPNDTPDDGRTAGDTVPRERR
ncbi:hypothetical protein A9W97_23655 [Mycobacterium gordonae]|nr:hypothetical protein [Mycobacterium gordonae]OBJ82581.1 hypothetical protein A9W97_23655 [Mycobacterium gordonae]